MRCYGETKLVAPDGYVHLKACFIKFSSVCQLEQAPPEAQQIIDVFDDALLQVSDYRYVWADLLPRARRSAVAPQVVVVGF